MIATRHLPILCVLLAAALVPTAIHSYANTVVVDGRAAADVPAVLAGFISAPSGRNPAWGQRRFVTDDWIERKYAVGRDDVVLTVVRSYDLKALYHHPELAVAYGPDFSRDEVIRFADRPEVPVHVLRTEVGTPAVGMYALLYEDRFVEQPIRFQIRTAGELLLSGRKAMTLFFAFDADASGEKDLAASPARRVLTAAIDAFQQTP
jgi:hypothetical protein